MRSQIHFNIVPTRRVYMPAIITLLIEGNWRKYDCGVVAVARLSHRHQIPSDNQFRSYWRV